MKEELHTKTCSQCNTRFWCGRAVGGKDCWCATLPAILPVDTTLDCLCPPCLKNRIKEKIAEYTAGIDPIQAAELDFTKYQTAEIIEGIDYYLESGNYVFTKWYHLKRGYCCKSGCRHCPYGQVQ